MSVGIETLKCSARCITFFIHKGTKVNIYCQKYLVQIYDMVKVRNFSNKYSETFVAILSKIYFKYTPFVLEYSASWHLRGVPKYSAFGE